jgi:hypothetical protein
MEHTENSSPTTTLSEEELEALSERLSAPFEAKEVKFKPAVVSGNRALALPYIDARVIQDRLDDVVGVSGWKDEYECLPDGSVVCRLHVRLGGEWITKTDVGGPSEQPDEGDRRKAAFSDSLKRAAVKFGIGRYLYRLPQQWCDYDPQKRQFVRKPSLPASVLPEPAEKNGTRADSGKTAQPAAPVPDKKGAALPANGAELHKRLSDYDARLAKQKLCRPGELVKHVVHAGVQAGFGPDLSAWSGPAITLAVEETRAFEARLRTQVPAKKDVA